MEKASPFRSNQSTLLNFLLTRSIKYCWHTNVTHATWNNTDMRSVYRCPVSDVRPCDNLYRLHLHEDGRKLVWIRTQEEEGRDDTVYPKKYAHGFCFAVLCCGYTLTDFPISIMLTSLALWQSDDCPSTSKATLMNMDKYSIWIHYKRLHNHNKAKHNKTVCIFLISWYILYLHAVVLSFDYVKHVFLSVCGTLALVE